MLSDDVTALLSGLTTLANAMTGDMTTAEIEAQLMNLRSEAQDVLDALRAAYAIAAEPLASAIMAAVDAVTQEAAAVIEAKPPLITVTVMSEQTTAELAWSQYQDLSRVAEIVRLNSAITNPNRLRAGMAIRMYAQ